MKSIIALLLFTGTAYGQQLPTGPLQFIKDKKTVSVSQDTVNPANTVGLPIAGTIVATNPSVSGNNAPIPTSSTLVAGSDSGTLRPLSVTSSGGLNYLKVDASGYLPTGAATSANQVTGNASLSSIDGKLTSVTVGSIPSIPAGSNNIGSITNITGNITLPTGASTSANQTTANASLSSIDGKLTSVTVGTLPSIPAGSNSIGSIIDITGNISLPTGASTSANQTTANSSLSSIDSKLTSVSVGAITGPVSLPIGAATESTLQGIQTRLPGSLGANPTATSLAVNIASDQVVNVKPSVASTGSGSSAGATVSSVTTLSAPANATGFILQNMDTSTANIRWAIGRTATATLGQQLQPGRDTVFVPCSSNVSLVAESGTQTYDIQWVTQ